MTKEQQLLKEAAEAIDQLLTRLDKNSNSTWDRKAILEGIKTKGTIETFLSQPRPEPVTALSWEQCCDKSFGNYNYNSYAHYLKVAKGEHDDWDFHMRVLEEAADLFMEANIQQRWISVEERLPENRQKVLFVLKDWKEIRMGVFLEKDQFDRENMFCDGAFFSKDRISGWQPLPEIPKEFKG